MTVSEISAIFFADLENPFSLSNKVMRTGKDKDEKEKGERNHVSDSTPPGYRDMIKSESYQSPQPEQPQPPPSPQLPSTRGVCFELIFTLKFSVCIFLRFFDRISCRSLGRLSLSMPLHFDRTDVADCVAGRHLRLLVDVLRRSERAAVRDNRRDVQAINWEELDAEASSVRIVERDSFSP